MMTSLVQMLVVAALFVGIAVWTLKKRARTEAAVTESLRDFLEQTGYRVASVPGGSRICSDAS